MPYDATVLHMHVPSVQLDVEGMTPSQEGTYHRIIRHLWVNGPQPIDVLIKMGGNDWRAISPVMSRGKSGRLSLKWLEILRLAANKTPEEREADRVKAIEKKKEVFRVQCRLVHQEFDILTNSQVKAFFNHWSQADNRSSKLHWEKQKTFEIKTRMEKWRDSPYNKVEKQEEE